MAKIAHKLTAKQVVGLPLGLHSDGGNLYLRVRESGSRQFVFLYRADGRQREMGLGGTGPHGLTLAQAEEIRTALRAGRDPIREKEGESEAEHVEDGAPLFGAFADSFVAAKEGGWRNAKHRDQWKMTLKTYAAPLRNKPVDEITTQDVERILAPMWLTKNETARRLRGRIETILNAARVQGHIPVDRANPARFSGHLELILPKFSAANRGHHEAMRYGLVPIFVTRLRKREAVTALALEFLILTAARSGEVIGMTWGEVRLQEKLWTVPATRMKSGCPHEVPLSDRAVAILQRVAGLSSQAPDEFVFQGQRRNQPLSNMSLEMLLRRMKVDVTVHGFRSSFRDWAGDETHFPSEVAEAALAHAVGSKTEQAYRRGSALAKRRELMDAWAEYCGTSCVAVAPA
ncbi:MAG: integrase [Methylocystaceae bacterium]|nr:MAG: integrase [Methylocystaceae bacterium]